MSALCRPADPEAAAMFEFPVEATVGYPTTPGHGDDHDQASRAPSILQRAYFRARCGLPFPLPPAHAAFRLPDNWNGGSAGICAFEKLASWW